MHRRPRPRTVLVPLLPPWPEELDHVEGLVEMETREALSNLDGVERHVQRWSNTLRVVEAAAALERSLGLERWLLENLGTALRFGIPDVVDEAVLLFVDAFDSYHQGREHSP